jgi:hypothetical protein
VLVAKDDVDPVVVDRFRDRSFALRERLADEMAVPRVPQRFVEMMARTRPTANGEEAVVRIEEMAVGPTTAREIGWTSP